MSEKKWVVYLVRCSDNSLYCGISNDIKSRLMHHNSGSGAKYTKPRRPVEFVGMSSEMTKSEALKLEYRIKRVPVDKKIAELTGKEKGMTISKKDLQALNKDVKALERKMEKLIKDFDTGKKAKTIRRLPAEKAPAKKRPAKLTATDKVLRIIKGSKKGVDSPTLVKKTGFNDKKIQNILFRNYKLGRIKRVDRGKYVGA
jgi:putative endonuclease